MKNNLAMPDLLENAQAQAHHLESALNNLLRVRELELVNDDESKIEIAFGDLSIYLSDLKETIAYLKKRLAVYQQ